VSYAPVGSCVGHTIMGLTLDSGGQDCGHGDIVLCCGENTIEDV
jgi:hypothetical protein